MVRFGTLLPILAGLLGVANAHTRVYSIWVNGVDQGDGRGIYIRSPPSDSPVKDVSRSDIICNVKNTVVAKSVAANAGDELAFEWYHDNRGDDIIGDSHKGPITVYIADAASDGAGNVWTKLAESGLEGGVWAVDTLKANGGKHSVTLPLSLAPGNYLMRAEIIALHESDTNYVTNNARGAQFYPSCAQVAIAAGGSTAPPGTFNFIGGYTPTDPGILFDLYNHPTSYPIPGPPVWTGAGGAAVTSTKARSIKAVSSKYPTTTYPPVVIPTTLATRTKRTTTTSFTKKPVYATKKPVYTTIPTATTGSICDAPATVPQSKTPEAVNKCLDEVNACIRQAQGSIGGAVNFQPCEERRASCYV